MRISIGHVSRYSYAEPASYTIQALRLTPPVFTGQKIIEWSISAPGFETSTRFRDCFGNEAHLVSHTGLHSEVLIIAKGVVDTSDQAGIVRGLADTTHVRVFLRETDTTRPDDAIRDLAFRPTAAGDLDRLHSLMHEVRRAVEYRTGTTGEHTSAAASLADGQGVCQDHAHIFISCARVLGYPARYVNGYFLSGGDEPAEAHHAWAETWIENIGWVGFDPANLICPTDHYVRLATGLDSASAAPIRGTRRGGANEALDVIVEVQQQNNQQQ